VTAEPANFRFLLDALGAVGTLFGRGIQGSSLLCLQLGLVRGPDGDNDDCNQPKEKAEDCAESRVETLVLRLAVGDRGPNDPHDASADCVHGAVVSRRLLQKRQPLCKVEIGETETEHVFLLESWTSDLRRFDLKRAS
jgi:hypothetical protein